MYLLYVFQREYAKIKIDLYIIITTMLYLKFSLYKHKNNATKRQSIIEKKR